MRKVIIDCDPGVDDAVALCIALFAPELDVLAVTAVEGCVSADQANVNLHGLIDRLDPRRLPRLGEASPADNAPAVDTRTLHGDNGIGNLNLDAARFQHPRPSDKLICDVVRAYPGDVTILTLGPLTNVARAFRRDPQLPAMVGELIMTGGSPDCIGNITPSAEFNVYYDPASAREVFLSKTTKTLIPLDITKTVSFGLDLVEDLPSADSRAGRILRKIIPFFFRAYHQRLGLETINLNDVVGLLAAIEPNLFETAAMSCDVEENGELTRGVTVFDRRPCPEWRENMEVARKIDEQKAIESITRRMQAAGKATV